MAEQYLPAVVDFTVYNPDFYKDVVHLLRLDCTEGEVKAKIREVDDNNPLDSKQIDAGELSLKERLIAFIDRLEFVHHLDVLSRYAESSNFEVLGEEVVGVHWDIRSLRIYLALTCIDIFCQSNLHRDHFEQSFSGLEGEVAERVKRHLSLVKADGTPCSMKELGVFFYQIRNSYTHGGTRFHIMGLPGFKEHTHFKSGSRTQKNEQYLTITEKGDLIGILEDVAIFIAKKHFGW